MHGRSAGLQAGGAFPNRLRKVLSGPVDAGSLPSVCGEPPAYGRTVRPESAARDASLWTHNTCTSLSTLGALAPGTVGPTS